MPADEHRPEPKNHERGHEDNADDQAASRVRDSLLAFLAKRLCGLGGIADGLGRLRAVTSIDDSTFEGVLIEAFSINNDPGPFGRQVDPGVRDAGNSRQCPLDPGHATGAVHPRNREFPGRCLLDVNRLSGGLGHGSSSFVAISITTESCGVERSPSHHAEICAREPEKFGDRVNTAIIEDKA